MYIYIYVYIYSRIHACYENESLFLSFVTASYLYGYIYPLDQKYTRCMIGSLHSE